MLPIYSRLCLLTTGALRVKDQHTQLPYLTSMNLTKNRVATVLILVFILAACAHAHPNGAQDPFDHNMDWPWDLFSVGEQFADAFAYNHFNTQMVGPDHVKAMGCSTDSCLETPPSRPTNSRSVTSPPHHSQSQVQPQLQPSQAPSTHHGPDYFSFPNMGLPGHVEVQQRPNNPPSAPILTFAREHPPTIDNRNNTAMAQWVGDQVGIGQLGHETTQMDAGYQAFETVPAPANAANMYGYPDAPQPQHQQWPSQPQPTQMLPQHGLQNYNVAHFDVHASLSVPRVGEQLIPQPSHAANSVPQILPTEVTSNPNYQPGMLPSAPGNMLGWIRRAPAIGERTLPSRLDTNLLAPPEANSANRSPTSASTTGSSAHAGSRRHKWEMTGDFLCHWCSAGLSTQGDLTHHLRSHQPYLSRQHVCQHCDKRFQYRKDLMRHLPKHDPNRKKYYCIFKGCKYYSRGFGRQDHLDRHIQTQHRVDTPQQSSRPSSSNHA